MNANTERAVLAPEGMNHGQARQAASLAAEGDLAPDVDAELKAHLQTCRECSGFSDSLSKSMDLFAAAAGLVPKGLFEAISGEIRFLAQAGVPGMLPAAAAARKKRPGAPKRPPAFFKKAAESELVALAKKGDCEAFGELVKRDIQRAYAQAIELSRNPDDGWDLVSEAYKKAWIAIPRFKGTAKFSTWRHAILRNVFRDFHAKTSRKGGLEVPMEGFRKDLDFEEFQYSDPSPTPEEQLSEKENKAYLTQRVKEAFGQLAPPARVLMQLVNIRANRNRPQEAARQGGRRKSVYAVILRYLRFLTGARTDKAIPFREGLDRAQIAKLLAEIQSRNAYDLKLLHARAAFTKAINQNGALL